MRAALKYVVIGGAIAGFLDIAYAFAFYGLSGVSPLRILQSIASGLLGRSSYGGGYATAMLGGVLHFCITIVASAIFYAASLRFRWLVRHAVLSGMGFGLGMYAVMNFVVVPLSAFPHRQAFPLLALATGLFSHMFFVGVPIALSARAAARDPRTEERFTTTGAIRGSGA